MADAICFDVAYDDGIHAQLRNGAELFVVQTSNATFIDTDQIDQQFAITRLRAIETGRWVAVAVDQRRLGGHRARRRRRRDGRASAPRAVLVEQVGLTSQLTPAMRIGPWRGRVRVGLTVLGVVLGLLARVVGADRRTPSPGGTPAREPSRRPGPVS